MLWSIQRLVYFALGLVPTLIITFWFYMPFPSAIILTAFLTIPTTCILGSIFILITIIFDHKRASAKEGEEDDELEKVRQTYRTDEAYQAKTSISPEELRTKFFDLYVGRSYGTLHERGHVGGVPIWTDIALGLEDCAKNFIIMGGTGSGKTSHAINPLLFQVLQQNCGVLIFDIKTDFKNTVNELSQRTNRTYTIIGDGGQTLNLIRGCTPELAASFLKSCFLVQGQGGGDSAFWVDSATELARHCLTLLNLLQPDKYNLLGLYDVIFDQSERDKLLQIGTDKIDKMSDREQRFFIQSQRFFINIWAEHDEKTRKNILSTVNAVLSPFGHPDLIDAFSNSNDQNDADITDLINKGSVFLVNLPMTKYGKEGAEFAYLLIKLRFMNMMRERRNRTEWDQNRSVVFLCDEYQAIIDPISDSDFWDKSRSTGTIGIVSMQGVSSLIHALKGNTKTAEAILQNFRQRFFFRTEDETTIRHINAVLGQVDVHVYTTSDSFSSGKFYGNNYNQDIHNKSSSESNSVNIQRQDLFSSNDMRALEAGKCLFIGNKGNNSLDDVLAVRPIFI